MVVSEKPWKSEAVLRLGVSLFICQFLGMLALATGKYFAGNRATSLWLFGAMVLGSVISCAVALYILRKPWDLDQFTRQFLWLIAGLYLGLMFGAFATKLAGATDVGPSTVRAIVAALSFQGMAIILVHRFVNEHATTWSDGFALAHRPGLAIGAGCLLACGFLPVGIGLQYATAAVMSFFNHAAEPQAAVQALKSSASRFDRAAFGVVAIGLAPVAEELLFRGILYPTIKRFGYPRLALWGTSLLFAVIHFNLPTFLPLLALALALTWLYEKSGNLLAPIAAHTLFNALNFLIFLYEPRFSDHLKRLWPFGPHA